MNNPPRCAFDQVAWPRKLPLETWSPCKWVRLTEMSSCPLILSNRASKIEIRACLATLLSQSYRGVDHAVGIVFDFCVLSRGIARHQFRCAK